MTLTTYEYTNNFVPPTEAYYRLTAKDGTYFVTKTPFWDATIRETTTRNKTLQPCTEAYTLHLPRKIDASTTIRAHAFFHTVKATHGTEALLLIFANPTTGEYDLVAPPQHNTPGSVTAHALCAPDDFVELGSIHSHPAGAFHSTTDIADETTSDGIHLVFGYVDRFVPDIVATLTVRGKRFPLNPNDVLDLPYHYQGSWLLSINHGGTK